MSESYYKNHKDNWRKGVNNGSADAPASAAVNEQHPLPIQIAWRQEGSNDWVGIDDVTPLPISLRSQANKYGSVFILDDIDRAIAAGYGHHITVGAFSTGVGGGAAAIIDIDQPQLAISVPSNTAIKPIRFDIQLQVGLVAADNDESEILIAVDTNATWDGDGTFTTEVGTNMRTGLGSSGTRCRLGSAFSADMTTTPPGGVAADPVLTLELARETETFDIFSTGVGILMKRIRLLYEPVHPPIIVGPATVLVYWGGTVEPLGGFCQAQYIEAETSRFMVD